MEIIKKILVLNYRSEYAYREYLKEKKYYQAKRIYNVNKELLEMLKEFQYMCEPSLLDLVCVYIFHLEDWFLQFEINEEKVSHLEDNFVFSRLNYSFSFPTEFYEKIKK